MGRMTGQGASLGIGQTRGALTGVERFLDEADIIVSKTDTRGIITYVNDTFTSISGYSEAEMIGKPHSIIRHPHMPRCIFKLLWDTIKSGHEIFAYVVNCCKNGDHYWVLAHVTPVRSVKGEIIGYHSNRRRPKKAALDVIIPLYQQLCALERNSGESSRGLQASTDYLDTLLRNKGVAYDEFVISLHTNAAGK